MSKRTRPNAEEEEEDEKPEYQFEKYYSKCEHTIHIFGHHSKEVYNHSKAGNLPFVTCSGLCPDCKAHQGLGDHNLERQTSSLRGQVNEYVVKLGGYSRKNNEQITELQRLRQKSTTDDAELERLRTALAAETSSRNMQGYNHVKYQNEKEAEITQLKAALVEKDVQLKQHQAQYANLVQRYNHQGQVVGSLRGAVKEFMEFNGGYVVNGVLVPYQLQQNQQILNAAGQSGSIQPRHNSAAPAVQTSLQNQPLSNSTATAVPKSSLQPLGSPANPLPPLPKQPQAQPVAGQSGTMAPRSNVTALAVQTPNLQPLRSPLSSLPPLQQTQQIQSFATHTGTMQPRSTSTAPAVQDPTIALTIQNPKLHRLANPGNSLPRPQQTQQIQSFATQTGTMQPRSTSTAPAVQNPNLQPFGSRPNPFPPPQKTPQIQKVVTQTGTVVPRSNSTAPTAQIPGLTPAVQNPRLNPLESPGNSLPPPQKQPQIQPVPSQGGNMQPRSNSTALAIQDPKPQPSRSPATSLPPPPTAQQDTNKEEKLKMIATIGYINPIISGFSSLKTGLKDHKWEPFFNGLFTELEQAVRWQEICAVRDRMRGSAETFDNELHERIETVQGEIVGACEEGVGRLLAAVLQPE